MDTTKTILDMFVCVLKENRNILNETDYPRNQDGWHLWDYWKNNNTNEKYQIRLSKLWDMSGRNKEKAIQKANQLDKAIAEMAMLHGIKIEMVNSVVSMNNPDRSMYNAEIKLISTNFLIQL